MEATTPSFSKGHLVIEAPAATTLCAVWERGAPTPTSAQRRANCDDYTSGNANTNDYSKTYTSSAASADAATAPISWLYQKEQHCSFW